MSDKGSATTSYTNNTSQLRIKNVGGKVTVLESKIGRNDPCPCGSGVKYKRCHLAKGATQ